jgi:hypothetical protein
MLWNTTTAGGGFLAGARRLAVLPAGVALGGSLGAGYAGLVGVVHRAAAGAWDDTPTLAGWSAAAGAALGLAAGSLALWARRGRGAGAGGSSPPGDESPLRLRQPSPFPGSDGRMATPPRRAC